MSHDLRILATAEALAAHAGRRQALISRNVAHADTPGWRALDLPPFAETAAAAFALEETPPLRPRATRPGHAGAPPLGAAEPREARAIGAESPNGNDVSVEDQMVRAAEAALQHELALGVWRKSLDILRASLGAPR